MKPYTITVDASEEYPEVLDIQDAMQQVQDYFNLITDHTQTNVVWKLSSATTMSPFTVTGEPVDLRTRAGGYGLIQEHIGKVRQGLERLHAGEDVGPDFPEEKREVATSLLQRNLNGIGITQFSFGENDPIVEFDKQTARRAINVLERKDDELYQYIFGSFSRREIGSIEGEIVDVATDNNEPAIHVEDRITGRIIPCRVDKSIQHEIERRLTAADVWERRHVRINGELNYDYTGKLIRIFRGRISFLELVDKPIDDIHDPSFTEGLSPQDYLDSLWGFDDG